MAAEYSFIDSHCHLHDAEFFARPAAEELIAAARSSKVQELVCIGTDPIDSFQAADFATSHSSIFWTYGIHPNEATSATLPSLISAINEFRSIIKASKASGSNLISRFSFSAASANFAAVNPDFTAPDSSPENPAIHKKPSVESSFDVADCSASTSALEFPVAIGEIGLDYHYSGYDRAAQIELLQYQLDLALNLDLPVVFHIREAFADFFPIVDNFPGLKAVVHSFSDNAENLEQSLSRGFYIGVNGIATFAPIPLPPLERILLETDAPFLAPAPVRGKTNHPGFIPFIADFLAHKFSVDINKIAEITTSNVRKLYQLP